MGACTGFTGGIYGNWHDKKVTASATEAAPLQPPAQAQRPLLCALRLRSTLGAGTGGGQQACGAAVKGPGRGLCLLQAHRGGGM